MTDKGKILRALHEKNGAFIIPNPWDIGSARILAGVGFKALATTSGGMAYGLGQPDASVGREATLRHCREIVSATSLPVSGDLEMGFGDSPESTFETIVAAAGVGLAGCSIEDYSGNQCAPIYDLALARERIEAASESCRKLHQDFVLTARCDNLLWGQTKLDKVIERLQAYEAAGADVLFAPGLNDIDVIREVCAAVTKPVNVVMVEGNSALTVAELANAGVKRISVGSRLAQRAYGSTIKAAREMAESGSFRFMEGVTGYDEIEAFFPMGEEK